MEPVAGSSSIYRERPKFMKRTLHQIADLDIKRSIGAISCSEYKRFTTLNELSSVAFSVDKTSLPSIYVNPFNNGILDFVQDDIISMEVDPRESKYLLTISKYNNVTLYNISDNVQIFEQVMRMTIAHNPVGYKGSPNSAHWFWDGNVFTVGTVDSVHFWDSKCCQIIETVRMNTKVLNHVIAAKKSSGNKHVAVTGIEGHVFIVDLRTGAVVMTIHNVEKTPVRAICWHPEQELQYVTGNNNGNIHLWDIRFQKNYIRKFNLNSFSKNNSHYNPVIGLNFYNNGHSVISVDGRGIIKTWKVNNGEKYGNYYEFVSMCDLNKKNIFKSYQFAVTENLKQDIVFLPTKKGLRMFDINTGEHLPYSNDVCLPLTCATYDPNRFRVYGGSNDLVKLWTPEQKNRV